MPRQKTYKAMSMLIQHETQINQILDLKCIHIDNKNSSKIKRDIIINNLLEADKQVKVITQYVNMLSETKQYIYKESFLDPWIQFRDLINSIKKSTKFLRIVSEPIYKFYYQFFIKEQSKLKYTDCQHALSIDEISSCASNYAKFYEYLTKIFMKMKDVNDYKKQIEIESIEMMKQADEGIPFSAKKDYEQSREFIQALFQRLFRYKLGYALSNEGKFPTILDVIKDNELIIATIDQFDKQQKDEESMIYKQARFLFSFVNNSDEIKCPEIDQFKQAMQELGTIMKEGENFVEEEGEEDELETGVETEVKTDDKTEVKTEVKTDVEK